MTNFKVMICNIIIAVISTVAMIGYFVAPYFQVKAAIPLTQELLSSFTESGEGEDEGDMMQQVLDELASSDITLELSVTIESKTVLNALSGETEAAVNEIIDGVVDQIILTLDDNIDSIVRSIGSTAVQTTVREQVREQLVNSTGSATEEEVTQMMEDIGLDEEYLDEQTNAFVDSLLAEDATVDSVTETTVSIVEDVIITMQESGVPEVADIEMTPELREQITESVSEMLSTFADEEGNLNLNDASSLLSALLGMMNGTTGDSNGGGEAYRDGALIVSAEDSDADDVKAQIRAMIEGVFTPEVLEILSYAFTALAVLLIFCLFTWAFLLLKLLVKLLFKNRTIRFGLPMWLGSLPFILFMLIPNAAITAVLPMIATGEMVFLSAISLSFFSSGVVAYCCGWALFILWFFYRKLRKQVKEQIRLDKAARQDAILSQTMAE